MVAVRHFEGLQNFGTLSYDRPWKHNNAYAHQISLKSDDSRHYSNKTIFKMAAVRSLEFSKFGIVVT